MKTPNPHCKLCNGTGQKPIPLLTKTVYDPCSCLKESEPLQALVDESILDALLKAANQTQPATTIAPLQGKPQATRPLIPDLLTAGLVANNGKQAYSYDSHNLSTAAHKAYDAFQNGLNVAVIGVPQPVCNDFTATYLHEQNIRLPQFFNYWVCLEGDKLDGTKVLKWHNHCTLTRNIPLGLITCRTFLETAYAEIDAVLRLKTPLRIGDGYDNNFILIDLRP